MRRCDAEAENNSSDPGCNRSSVHCRRHNCLLHPWLTVAGYSNAKMRFQSFFMLITVQPLLLASS
jgi:hypothetical protein